MQTFRLAASFAFLATALLVHAQEGKYREEIRGVFRGSDTTLVRTLNLNAGGSADLYSEYRGAAPEIDLYIEDEFGRLMRDVREGRKVKHSGSWRRNGDRLVVELTRLDAGGRERSLHSIFEFTRSGDSLRTDRQDSGDYGDREVRLRLIERWDGSGGGEGGGGRPDLGDSRYRGNYAWAESVDSADGESLLARRLRLNSDGDAEVISEYLGSKPRLSGDNSRQFGALLAEVVSNRRISHRGSWRMSDGRVRVELDRIGEGAFAQRVHSVFVLEPQGSDLVVREIDEGDYGNRSVRFRKDWNPSRPSGGGGKGPVFQEPVVRELDVTSEGGGYASLQERRAQELRSARLILRRDGRFEVRLQGNEQLILQGRYDARDGNRIQLDVREAFGSSSSGAGVAVVNDRGALRSLEIRGESRGRRFTVTFDAR